MLTILPAMVSLVSFRFRRRASLELEVLALRHQVAVLHRQGFRRYWRWRSRPRPGRPGVNREIRDLIRRMSLANPLWGAPRIHGEMLKLGIAVSQQPSEDIWSGGMARPHQPGGPS